MRDALINTYRKIYIHTSGYIYGEPIDKGGKWRLLAAPDVADIGRVIAELKEDWQCMGTDPSLDGDLVFAPLNEN